LTRDQVDEYYLTVAEVAELLRLNQQTVRNWIDQGSLPALRVGRRVRIKQSDLDQLLSDGYSSGPHPEAGPSAEDFWGGEPVGVAELAAGAEEEAAVEPAGMDEDAVGATGAIDSAAGVDQANGANASSPAAGTDRGGRATSADRPR
jgi:excisionase family DNA binding protein